MKNSSQAGIFFEIFFRRVFARIINCLLRVPHIAKGNKNSTRENNFNIFFSLTNSLREKKKRSEKSFQLIPEKSEEKFFK